MKIAGLWSGHDASYAVLENGKPIIHNEYERFIREKEPEGDSIEFLFDTYPEYVDIKHFATCWSIKKLNEHIASFNKMNDILKENDGQFYVIGHHQAHAANAFFSSNFNDAVIITLDGGGIEDEKGTATACTIWKGIDNKIIHIRTFDMSQLNIGGLWTRVTRYVFQLQSGWPLGHQAGSVMALAAYGDKLKYKNDFAIMLTRDIQQASMKPSKQPKGALVIGQDPVHPYLDKWARIANKSQQNKADIAASLQFATELLIKQIIQYALSVCNEKTKNLCLSGGVTLNSVAVGKIQTWFNNRIENVYVTATPHDGGLTIGAAQYVWHHQLNNERITWKDNFTPYLGKTYTKKEITLAIESANENINITTCDDKEVIDLLNQQKIVAVFGGGSESGRRALGNRSILADPRDVKMKDTINEKVKHRQFYRPFAPSILKEDVTNWFISDVISPYMSFVVPFKGVAINKVRAVVHEDNTARLQTVTKNDNEWYYNFLTLWKEKTNIPMLLNTSFNDREPICETPEHAIKCFLGTDIDYLYFYNEKILICKK